MASFAANASGNAGGKGPLMDDTKLVKYKTVMCQRMVRVGNCRYGHLCDFAHDSNELRRNLNQHWYQGVMCDIPDHEEKKCEYAHNEMELMYHPNIYKTKLCDQFNAPGGCPKNQYCALAHGKSDLRSGKTPGQLPSKLNSSPGIPHNSPSPTTSPQAQTRRSDFDQKRPAPRRNGPDVSGPLNLPHRQQSFPNYVETSAQHMSMPMSQNDPQQEFQDSTNDLKIRILDLVDQISSMHTDRVLYESHQKTSQIVQDTHKMHREQTAQLHQQIESFRILLHAYQGQPSALARLSPNALQQLVKKSSLASAAIAAFKPSTLSTQSLIQDLSELDIS